MVGRDVVQSRALEARGSLEEPPPARTPLVRFEHAIDAFSDELRHGDAALGGEPAKLLVLIGAERNLRPNHVIMIQRTCDPM
jgi:hypothetical protein